MRGAVLLTSSITSMSFDAFKSKVYRSGKFSILNGIMNNGTSVKVFTKIDCKINFVNADSGSVFT